MKKIFIEGTKRTPKILFDNEKQYFEISGRSIPEDAFVFYEPLLSWTEQYIKQDIKGNTEIVINLDYYNTSSSMYLLNILKIMDELAANGKEVFLKWYFDEEDKEGWVEVFEDSLVPFLKYMKYEIIHEANS